MSVLRINNQDIPVDIREELNVFDWGSNAKWTHEKLNATSPFRHDRTPSFFVNLETGGWADLGAYDSEWASGNFTKLLAFLRNETYEETEDYLEESYGLGDSAERAQLIVPPLKERKSFRPLDGNTIEPLTSPYLTKRGISAEVQAQAGVGKPRYKGFVGIPWYLPDGRLANVKYRATRGKTFFYERGGYPIRQLVYNAQNVRTSGELIVCEAEIDALSWQTAGYNAVAVGGVAFNRRQADIIRTLPYTSIILAGDNDKAGNRFNEQAAEILRGERIATVKYRSHTEKDANLILTTHGVGALRNIVECAESMNSISVRI